MRVAILFTGHLRRRPLDGIKSHIKLVEDAFGVKAKVDVFILTYDNSGIIINGKDYSTPHNYYMDAKPIDINEKEIYQMGANSVVLTTEGWHDVQNKLVVPHVKYLLEQMEKYISRDEIEEGMLTSTFSINRQVRKGIEQIKKTKIRYDYILKARPDILAPNFCNDLEINLRLTPDAITYLKPKTPQVATGKYRFSAALKKLAGKKAILFGDRIYGGAANVIYNFESRVLSQLSDLYLDTARNGEFVLSHKKKWYQPERVLGYGVIKNDLMVKRSKCSFSVIR